MKSLIIFFSLLSIHSLAADIMFKANLKQDSQQSGQVTLGTIKVSADSIYEMPAGQIGDGTLIVKASKAKTFAEAMKICQQLVPVGKWKIPGSMAANFWAASIDKSMPIETNDKNSGAIFPMWTYKDITNAKERSELEQKAVAYAFRGGEAFEAFEIDLAQKKVNRKGHDPLPKDLDRLLFEKMQNGLTTYCELEPNALKETPAAAKAGAKDSKASKANGPQNAAGQASGATP